MPTLLLVKDTRFRRVAALAVLVLASGVLYAQEYNFRGFGVMEGLNNLAVRQIYQDRVGFIWVSTENGIFRFDGERFDAFGPEQGIPSTSSAAFGDAPDGSLLVGGDFGLYQLSGNRFEKLPVAFKTISWAQGIQSDGKGHTFIGTDSGLVELYSEPGRDGFSARTFPQDGTSGLGVYGVLVDDDILWYGCGDEVCRMIRGRTTVFGRDSGLPDCAWLTIQKDRAGDVWVRGKSAGVFVLPTGQDRFRRPDAPIPGSTMGRVATDGDGRMLILLPDGLLIRNEKGWQRIDRSAGLRGGVYAAFEDRQHSLWLGLAGRGLAEWRGYQEWESYSTASGLGSDLVYEILPQADGSMWVATEGGLFRGTRSPRGILWMSVAGVAGFPVHSIQRAPDGDLWIGTETRGVACIHARTGRVQWFGQKQGLSGAAAYTLRFDREQRLWAATDAGLFVAGPPYQKFLRIPELPSTRFWAIAEGTEGTIWAGGVGGLFGYSAGLWKNWTQADGLSNQEILSLGAAVDGTMWIGYRHGGGIDRIHPQVGGIGIAIEKGVQRPGSDGLVYFLAFDASGRLWVGTERGVDTWDGSRWSHYDARDGLAWDDCNLNAFAEEADGTVWIGTSGGLSRFKPRPSRASEAPPNVIFTGLVMGRTNVFGQHNPSFGIHSNSLIARYAAPNAPRQNGVVFRYRLKGARSAWTETAQRELRFAELSPGAYQLEIEARDSDGVWSGHRAEFAFEILPPWYGTRWFVGTCGLIPVLVVLGVLRLRMLGAQRREQELQRIVAEKTVDLRRANEDLSRLSSLDSLTGLANRRVFDQTLTMECARLKRAGSAVSLVMLDVDHFKALNDSEGHQRGDECLKLVGAELRRCAKRQIDLAARYGGEEFAVILPETGAAGAARVAESMRLAIASLKLPHPASPVAPFLTVSVGVATASQKLHSSPQELVAAADQALYGAKGGGRNRVNADKQEADPNTMVDR
jgi:diguanylate cyclase (GGDEF)-like protein